VRKVWIEIQVSADYLLGRESPSVRKVWIEMMLMVASSVVVQVTFCEEGVD